MIRDLTGIKAALHSAACRFPVLFDSFSFPGKRYENRKRYNLLIIWSKYFFIFNLFGNTCIDFRYKIKTAHTLPGVPFGTFLKREKIIGIYGGQFFEVK